MNDSSPFGHRIGRAALWAVSGGLLAACVWSAVAAVLYAPTPEWATAFIFAFYFAGFVALVATPFYTLAFALWASWTARHPKTESTPLRTVFFSLALAAPAVLAVLMSYLAPFHNLGPFYRETLSVAPLVLASAWLGVLVPRLVVPPLRPRWSGSAA